MPLEQPRARVSIDGVPVPGLVALEVDAAGCFLASRFAAGFALDAAPEFGGGYFVGLSNQSVQIDVAPDGVGYSALLTGQVDTIRIDWGRKLAVVGGRDLTSLLIDSEISESYVNQTASQIAAEVAVAHGLTPNVTPTTALVGQYYQLDHARTALGGHAKLTTAWELLTELARMEEYLVSVVGSVLNFGPPQPGMPLFVTTGSLSALTFDMVTALPGAAMVKSWNCRSKSVVSGSSGSGQMTTIVRPNLLQAQAQALAQGHLQILGQHRLIMEARMPADATLAPGMTLMLGGAGMGLDQSYVVDAVARRLDGKAGFVQRVRAHAAVL